MFLQRYTHAKMSMYRTSHRLYLLVFCLNETCWYVIYITKFQVIIFYCIYVYYYILFMYLLYSTLCVDYLFGF